MVTRADIEAKAREIYGAVEETKESARNTAILAGVAIATVVAIAFIVGRRRGSRNKTIVEVYRT